MLRSTFSAFRNRAVLLLVFGLALASIAAVTVLQQRANTSRVAQLRLSMVKDVLNELQSAPFKADKRSGGSATIAHALMQKDELRITQTLSTLRTGSSPAALEAVEKPLRANFAIVHNMYVLGLQYGAVVNGKAKQGGSGELLVNPVVVVEAFETVLAAEARTAAKTIALLEVASLEYDRRASRAETQALYGSAVAILLLFSAFWLFYARAHNARATAEVLVRENQRLLASSREEATTDALTGLGNRRALVHGLDNALAEAGPDHQIALALFDLDGFKQYNDTFGHPAGDKLLTRLGVCLAAALGDRGQAFRMGGDEFCVLAQVDAGEAEPLARLCAEALSEKGHAFEIGCSWGVTLIPDEAVAAEEALRLADQRMYEQKAASRTSASRQTTDVLVKVLSERDLGMQDHLSGVARLARLTAVELGLPDLEVRRIQLAAELHDVGKAAIPEAILSKPSKLNEEEWQFMRRHTLIGERILRAAPSLSYTADLVRSSHERLDGTGYPDGLRGDEIPLGSRIIAVCDAFDAMTSRRPYRDALPRETALAELRRCAGTQFDIAIVDIVSGLDVVALAA
jgi:diguanylate cyclase (GGDEF)-like protein